MDTLLLNLWLAFSIPACDSVPPDIGENMCGSPITIWFQNQHVNGCHVAPYFILDNVTSDSLILTAKNVTITGGALNKLEIRTFNCN